MTNSYGPSSSQVEALLWIGVKYEIWCEPFWYGLVYFGIKGYADSFTVHLLALYYIISSLWYCMVTTYFVYDRISINFFNCSQVVLISSLQMTIVCCILNIIIPLDRHSLVILLSLLLSISDLLIFAMIHMIRFNIY
jgi:hypothetical protein